MGTRAEKIAVIAGAGPAGLTAARELLRATDYKPVVFETSDMVGGISRTVNHNGNRIDIGGHRFFSKSKRVTDFWEEMMSSDADPETTDRAMLRRPRVSRIFFMHKFFDYPVTMSKRTFANMGTWRTLKAGMGYITAKIFKRKETSLENFYINRFGKPLYRMFFEDYTRKVWGVHPSNLGADWGSQRVKGLSLSKVLTDMIFKKAGKHRQKVETSLIEEFIYPKYGPGQLWEAVSDDVLSHGGSVETRAEVVKVHIEGDKVVAVTIKDGENQLRKVDCDIFISSMPIRDLISAIDGIDVPDDVLQIAQDLPYRDFITVGLLVDELALSNDTKTPTFKNRIPDTWVYIQDCDVKIGRLQVFNNWSPYMVKDFDNTMWIGLEYFCSEDDEMWNMPDRDFIEMAKNELERIGFIKADSVLDAVRIKIHKAYPAYFGSYARLGKVKAFLDSIDNLYCIGRNGQHRYNNMDHSMLTAMEAVDAIAKGLRDKSAIWSVNTDDDYHETSE